MSFNAKDYHYNPERDGDIGRYIFNMKEDCAEPLFRGYGPFKELVRRDYVIPGGSSIRLMWNVGRDDEYFLVNSEGKLEGLVDLSAHAGRKGIFEAEEILDDPETPFWEIHGLDMVRMVVDLE